MAVDSLDSLPGSGCVAMKDRDQPFVSQAGPSMRLLAIWKFCTQAVSQDQAMHVLYVERSHGIGWV